jgi:hypothetical protein
MNSPSSYFSTVRLLGVRRVASALGFESGHHGPVGGFIRPCPACGAGNRHASRGDKRGAIGLTTEGLGWRCHECGAGGDAVTFAAWAITQRAKPADWRAVREGLQHCLSGVVASPVPPSPRPAPEPVYPPGAELRAFWDSAHSLEAILPNVDPAWCGDARKYLASRGLSAQWLAQDGSAARIGTLRPSDCPSWWPASRLPTWRLLLPAYNARGELVTIQGRSIRHQSEPKTLWPKGYSTAGVLFADPHGVTFLRNWQAAGAMGGLEAVVVVEGATDTLKLTQVLTQSTSTIATLGYVAGSQAALRKIAWPAAVPCVVAVDDDTTGDAYCAQIRAALPVAVPVFRIRPPQGRDAVGRKLSDWCDLTDPEVDERVTDHRHWQVVQ